MEKEKEIGARIKERRTALGLTQEDLAERLNVTFQAVSKWENGISMPDITLFHKLANVLELTVDELLNGATSETPNAPKKQWGKITGTVTKDIHGDVGKIVGDVEADIYGNVNGDIIGTVRNIFGNVEGNIMGEVQGDITGYVAKSLFGTVQGSVKLGIRGRCLGTVIGDGINVVPDKKKKKVDKS